MFFQNAMPMAGYLRGLAPSLLPITFAFGAKAMIANLLAAQSLTQTYNAGDTVRIGAIEGKLLQITRTGVKLETPEGQILIPAQRFVEQESVLVSRTGQQT